MDSGTQGANLEGGKFSTEKAGQVNLPGFGKRRATEVRPQLNYIMPPMPPWS